MPTNGPARPDHCAQPANDGHTWRTAGELAAAGRFRIIQATRAQWVTVEEWIAREGGDPGLADMDIYFRLDPGGFFLGMLDGEPVSAVSIVNYGPRISFLGTYTARPGMLGRGFELATWRTAVGHANSRAIGLEAHPDQVTAYRNLGFTDLYTTIGYWGRITNARRSRIPAMRRTSANTVPYQARHAQAIAALDGSTFPQNRPTFADTWAKGHGHRTLVRTDGQDVVGYGVIRPTTLGYQIGPLIAHAEADAEALFDALTAELSGEVLNLHAPEPNRAALNLARSRDLIEISRTIRMYSQPARPIALNRCYAIGSVTHG